MRHHLTTSREAYCVALSLVRAPGSNRYRAMKFFAVRRVRVRPEFAWLYPEIVPGVWMSAAKAARLAQQTDPMQQRAHSCACRRLLCEIHFEFRGGCSREKRTGAWQSRVEYRGPYKICFDLVPTSASELIDRHTLDSA
jgi:hypothetical protein